MCVCARAHALLVLCAHYAPTHRPQLPAHTHTHTHTHRVREVMVRWMGPALRIFAAAVERACPPESRTATAAPAIRCETPLSLCRVHTEPESRTATAAPARSHTLPHESFVCVCVCAYMYR